MDGAVPRGASRARARVDAALQSELGGLAVAKARGWTDRQAAAALLHLAIDAFIYLEQGKPSLGLSTGEAVAELPALYDVPAAKPAPAPALPGTAPLPEVLRAVADEALGFLKDGHHVLLAGAPGTGKTTVAPPSAPGSPEARPSPPPSETPPTSSAPAAPLGAREENGGERRPRVL